MPRDKEQNRDRGLFVTDFSSRIWKEGAGKGHRKGCWAEGWGGAVAPSLQAGALCDEEAQLCDVA